MEDSKPIEDPVAVALRVESEWNARRASMRPSQGRRGGVMTRSLYAQLKRIAVSRWGESATFPRLMDHTYPEEVIDFLTRHIKLFERAREESLSDYIQTYRDWVSIQGGRIPVRMRRYLSSEYRSNVQLRTLERRWAKLGGHAIDDSTLFLEMDLARYAHPQARDWNELCVAALADKES